MENEIDKSVGRGEVYATISCRPYGIDGYVDLYTSPLILLRDVQLRLENQKNTTEIENLKALLKLVGLRDLRDF